MLTSATALLALSLGRPSHAPVGGAVPAPPLLFAGAASAAEAAEAARRQTGGRVLSVERSGGGYQVKVLTPAGEVRVVFIPAAGG
ncbi:hypothetical protein [uncultured Thiodictyon sp.]|uniref:hypothetical protein n=1 Tax=uncultured Thiodictyon sp. TaxID=1846217 RepID=UPI0025EBBADD|nr:hypothetical protein [uncultured Thiodictyon sp.]